MLSQVKLNVLAGQWDRRRKTDAQSVKTTRNIDLFVSRISPPSGLCFAALGPGLAITWSLLLRSFAIQASISREATFQRFLRQLHSVSSYPYCAMFLPSRRAMSCVCHSLSSECMQARSQEKRCASTTSRTPGSQPRHAPFGLGTFDHYGPMS